MIYKIKCSLFKNSIIEGNVETVSRTGKIIMN